MIVPEKCIVLEECFNEEGQYMGRIVVYETDLTPVFLDKIKADKDDKMGWKKYRKIMKKAGYDIE